MVYSASELNRSTGLPVLGALASDRTKKAGKLDAKLYQMEGRPDGSADAEMLCLMAQTIRSRAPEAKNILVTGDLPADQLEALAADVYKRQVLLQPCFGRAVFVCCAPAHKKNTPVPFGPGVFCCDRECQVEEESIFCSWVLAR